MPRPRTRFASAAALSILALPLASCTDLGGNLFCGADVVAEVDALLDATTALTANVTTLEGDILVACKNIAQDLTGTRPNPTGTLDEQVQAACTAARDAIAAQVSGGAQITFAYAAPVCHVDASAQLSCEASCDVNATCNEGTVEVRCDPGDLSVICTGMCQAGAVCEATVMAPTVTCQGSCDGVCTGMCNGGTQNAAGECTGTCSGTCTGNCTIQQGSAGVSCGAYARCRGGCSVTGTEPRCESTLNPPSCAVDADCQGACEASGNFSASCEPGTVQVFITGGTNATALTNTLEANLGVFLEIRDGLQTFVADAATIANSASGVAASLQGSALCALSQVTQLAASAQDALAVATSLEVTVSVSVMVTASAGVPAN